MKKKQRKASRKFVQGVKIILKKKKTASGDGHKQYKNLSEDEKQKLAEYRKKYYKIQKNKNASQIKT